MKKILGVFRRDDSTPFKVLENGKVRSVKKGEIAFLEYETYKDVWGFSFLGFADMSKQPSKNKKIEVEEIKEEVEETPTSIEVTDEETFEPEEESLGIEIPTYVKKLTNKDYFVMKKEKCKEILDEIGADYSAIKDDKWSLVNFLKSIIKEI